jgi:hypothetical protein
MSFSPFHYWRRGVQTTKMINKVPRGYVGSLVKARIEHGDFDPCPYWEMSMEEIALWQSEVDEYRAKGYGRDAVEEFSRARWAIYKKRIDKLREAHCNYEELRLNMLRVGLVEAFNIDVWDEAIEKCEGDTPMDLYNTYNKLAVPARKIRDRVFEDAPYWYGREERIHRKAHV